MKGYHTSDGYKGFVNGQWMTFPTDTEYVEYMEEMCDKS